MDDINDIIDRSPDPIDFLPPTIWLGEASKGGEQMPVLQIRVNREGMENYDDEFDDAPADNTSVVLALDYAHDPYDDHDSDHGMALIIPVAMAKEIGLAFIEVTDDKMHRYRQSRPLSPRAKRMWGIPEDDT